MKVEYSCDVFNNQRNYFVGITKNRPGDAGTLQTNEVVPNRSFESLSSASPANPKDQESIILDLKVIQILASFRLKFLLNARPNKRMIEMHFQGDPTDKEKVMLGQVIKKSINPLPFEKRTGQRKEYYSS